MLRAASAAPRFLASNGDTCLYSVPTEARSASSSVGQLTAPGSLSRAYSLSERASMTALKESRRCSASAAVTVATGTSGLGADCVEHFRLDLQLQLVLLQRRAVDQEGVLDALAQGRDLGELQVDV